MNVDVRPLSPWMRRTRFRPLPPPVFPRGEPTLDEVELALALYRELDDESRRWYGPGFEQRLVERLRG